MQTTRRPSFRRTLMFVALLGAGCQRYWVCDDVDQSRTKLLPEHLSETGLYADIATGELAPGVAPFTPRFSLWSDGSEKQRWLLLPDGAQIDTSNMDEWTFPEGTKVWKQFSSAGVRLETRLHREAWTDRCGLDLARVRLGPRRPRCDCRTARRDRFAAHRSRCASRRRMLRLSRWPAQFHPRVLGAATRRAAQLRARWISTGSSNEAGSAIPRRPPPQFPAVPWKWPRSATCTPIAAIATI